MQSEPDYESDAENVFVERPSNLKIHGFGGGGGQGGRKSFPPSGSISLTSTGPLTSVPNSMMDPFDAVDSPCPTFPRPAAIARVSYNTSGSTIQQEMHQERQEEGNDQEMHLDHCHHQENGSMCCYEDDRCSSRSDEDDHHSNNDQAMINEIYETLKSFENYSLFFKATMDSFGDNWLEISKKMALILEKHAKFMDQVTLLHYWSCINLMR